MAEQHTGSAIESAIIWGIVGTAVLPGVGTLVGAGIPLLHTAYRRWRDGAPEREAKRLRKTEERRREAEHRLRLQILEEQQKWAATPPAPPPPPPTREEVVAAARQRYDAALRLLDAAGLDDTERGAARERAKQLYLREIDGVMR